MKLIKRDWKYYKILRLRWLLYLIVAYFFFNRFFEYHKTKIEHQKVFFEFYEYEIEVTFKPHQWLSKYAIFKPIAENFGSYEIAIHEEFIEENLFREMSNFSNISSITFDPYNGSLSPFVFKCLKETKVKALKLDIYSLQPGALQELSKIESLEFLHLYLEHIYFEELKYLSDLNNLKELELYIRKGPGGFRSGPLPITGFLYNELSYIPEIKSLKTLTIDAPLNRLIPHIRKFPSLNQLNIAQEGDGNSYLISSNELFDELLNYKNLKVNTIDMGIGITEQSLSKLHLLKFKNLTLSISKNLDKVQWSKISNLDNLTLPPFVNVNKVLKKMHSSLATNLHSESILIDPETLDLFEEKLFFTVRTYEAVLTPEAKDHLQINGDKYGLLKQESQGESGLLLKDDKLASRYSDLTPEDLLKVKDKGHTHESFSFDHLSIEHVKALDRFPNLKFLDLTVNSGLANLNEFTGINSIKDLRLKIKSLPKEPLKVKNLKTLEIEAECSGKLDQLIEPACLNKLTHFSIKAYRLEGDFDITALKNSPQMERIEVFGSIVMKNLAEFPKLDSYLSESGDPVLLKSFHTSNNLDYINVPLRKKANSYSLKALLQQADKVSHIDLSYANLIKNDYELILSFKNVEGILLPFHGPQLTLKKLREILNLPKLSYICMSESYFTKSQLESLTLKERDKINLNY